MFINFPIGFFINFLFCAIKSHYIYQLIWNAIWLKVDSENFFISKHYRTGDRAISLIIELFINRHLLAESVDPAAYRRRAAKNDVRYVQNGDTGYRWFDARSNYWNKNNYSRRYARGTGRRRASTVNYSVIPRRACFLILLLRYNLFYYFPSPNSKTTETPYKSIERNVFPL